MAFTSKEEEIVIRPNKDRALLGDTFELKCTTRRRRRRGRQVIQPFCQLPVFYLFPNNLETGKKQIISIVLPLFGNDTANPLNIDFTQFFRQIGKFLNFRNEIHRT